MRLVAELVPAVAEDSAAGRGKLCVPRGSPGGQ